MIKETNGAACFAGPNIITETETMDFNPNHQLWWTVDGNDVKDFFTYELFMDYVRSKVQRLLDAGYAVVTNESQFRIEITFAKKGTRKQSIVFQMCDDEMTRRAMYETY